MKKSSPLDLDKEKNRLLKEIEEIEREIGDITKRIPPHSVRFESIQLLEQKEEELEREKMLLTQEKRPH
jgi:hypothetical protein